ncbi:MAG: sugar phosphate isomerase/epimerase family protein [Armatimonadota bacterium]
MYLSVRDDIVRYAGYKSILEGLRDLDIPTVELSVDRNCTVSALEPVDGRTGFDLTSDSDLLQLKSHINEREVGISAFLVANDFGAQNLESEIQWVASAVRAADTLGVPAVRIDAVMSGEDLLPMEERLRRFADAVRKVLDATSGCAVDLGMENHGVQGNNPDFVLGLLDAVGSPRFGLTLDSGNFYWAGHPLEEVYSIFGRLAPYTKHTHLKNISYPEEVRNRKRDVGWKYETYVSPLPDGDIDHGLLVTFLREAGYDRDLTLEDESLGRYPVEERPRVLRRDADHIRSLL